MKLLPRGQARAAAAVVIVALLVQSVGLGPRWAMAQEGTPPAAVTGEEIVHPAPEVVPEPAPVVVPTAAPEPSPTVAPSDLPPPAPGVPTPAESSAAPVDAPAPAEALPTAPAAATAAEPATIETDAATTEAEPAATLAPAPDTLGTLGMPDRLDCAPADRAAGQPGHVVEFGCVLVAGSAWGGVRFTAAPVSSTAPPVDEWTVAAAAVDVSGVSSWSAEGPEAAIAVAGELAPAAALGFAVRVRVPAQASAGDAATVAVAVDDPGRAGAAPVAPVVARFEVVALEPPPDALSCAAAGAVAVPAGETVDLACALTVNSAREGTRLETAATASGDPWGVELAPAPAGETAPDADPPSVAVWDEATARSPGDTVALTLRLTAPATAAPGAAAQIAVAAGRITTAVGDPDLDDAGLTLDATVAEPEPELEPEFGAASVVAETGGLDCSEPNGDRVTPDGQVAYGCRFSAVSGLSLSTEFVATMNTPGWDVALSETILGSSPLNGDGTARITSTLVTNLLANLLVTVKAPAGAAPGATADVAIAVRTCTVLWVGTSCILGTIVNAGSATIRTTVGAVAPVTGTFGALGVDVASLACYPASASGSFAIAQGGQLPLTCSLYTLLSAALISGGAQLAFSSITSSFPAGWGVQYVINGQSYTALSGATLSLGSLDLLALSTNGVFSFAVLLTAPCTAPLGSAAIGLSTGLDVNLVGLGVQTGLGPSVTLPPNVEAGSFGAATAAFVSAATPVSFGTAPITGLSGATQTGSAQLSVSRPACAAATVSVGVTGSGGSFNPPAGGGNPIPLANLRMTSVSGSPSDSGLAVAPPPAGGTAVTANPAVATVNAVTGTATYTLTLGASLAVPAETRQGTHTATLQVTVVGTTP